MFRNYLKITFRALHRQRVYAMTNIVGLAVGLACCYVIMLYVMNELSYDRYHENEARIFRVLSEKEDTNTIVGAGPYRLAPVLQSDLPEVEAVTRLRMDEVLIRKEESFIKEERLARVDQTFFDIFTIPLIRGNRDALLDDPYAIVLTETMARKYFGSEDPIGKSLVIRNKRGTSFDATLYDMVVTGVVEDLPANSHLGIDFFIPLSSIMWGTEETRPGIATRPRYMAWADVSFATYVLLKPSFSPEELEAKFPALIHQYIGDTYPFSYRLQALRDIYLFSDAILASGAKQGVRSLIYLFALIGALIVVIAGINYVVLSTARSVVRAKEVGVRKVVGAHRKDLILQIMFESIVVVVIALPVALLLAIALLPSVSHLLGAHLAVDAFLNTQFIAGLIGMSLLVGLLSGSYIAIYLSAYSPMDIIRGKLYSGMGRTFFRNALIVVQLSIFVVLGLCTLLILQQVDYLVEGKDLGFDRERVLSIHLGDRASAGTHDSYMSEILNNPAIKYVSASQSPAPANQVPTRTFYHYTDPNSGRRITSSGPVASMGEPDNIEVFGNTYVDYDYIEALGLRLVAGRSFSRKHAADHNAVVVNEAFVKARNLKDPVGQVIPVVDQQKVIIGVVEDFHAQSLRSTIEPMVLHLGPFITRQIIVKAEMDDLTSLVAYLKETWGTMNPESTFEYSMLDETLAQWYKAEQNLGKLVGYFAFFAILVSCLGLFSLTLFITEQRTKEVGVRKVFGASTLRIVRMITAKLVLLVIVANLIAWPVSWFMMHRWLAGFAYHIEISWPLFLVVGFAALLITLLTVSFQIIKAARVNPVVALRYE